MATFSTLPEFEDFDNVNVYTKAEEYILEADALNFVIEFNDEKAHSALELPASSIQNFISPKPPTTITRWINLWCPEQQTDVIKVLASHYGFTPRLAGLMCQQHDTPKLAVVSPQHNVAQASPHPFPKLVRKSHDSQSTDPEKNDLPVPCSPRLPDLDLNHYRLVDEVWYYCSVDWGKKYLCIGYNSLSQLRATGVTKDPNEDHISNKPEGRRLWTWLILCDDDTIISIHENPFPNRQADLDSHQQNIVTNMRRNLWIVFKQLSKVNDTWRMENAIMSLQIRPGLQTLDDNETSSSESSSLLFYYLFDDWYTSYSLVSKQEHQYGKQLGLLRAEMFRKPEVKHIERLHHIGQQLAVLKKLYQSYELIIERILDRQKPVDMSKSTHPPQQTVAKDTEMSTAKSDRYAVPLSSASTVRFERLRDRIKLYALSEIQECLDEKESLVFLNFNLITLKQSAAVERLTRITILLAKVTILFMPVSLMTGYFSVQIDDLSGLYTAKTYWVSFAVIMALSFVFLLVFGMISDTVEGGTIYRSFTQMFFEKSRDNWRKRKFSYKS